MKTCTLREDFLKITGCYQSAMILDILVSYTRSSFHIKELIEEELDNIDDNIHSFLEGWFTKSYEQLSEETLLKIDKKTISTYIKVLLDKGYIQERIHPNDKWNKAKQYRVNIARLQRDLLDNGYCLEGFPVSLERKITSLLKTVNNDDKLEYIKKEWNRIAIIQGYTKVNNITGARKQGWLRILKEHPDKQTWKDFFAMLEREDHKWLATASMNDIKWFNIDFFYKKVGEDRINKVVEGFYARCESNNFSKNSYVGENSDIDKLNDKGFTI